MLRIPELRVPLEQPAAPSSTPTNALLALAAHALGIDASDIAALEVFRRSVDARSSRIWMVYTVDVALADANDESIVLGRLPPHSKIAATPPLPPLPSRTAGQAPAVRPVIVGFGPCGMFAALWLARMGLCPIVLEQGKAVRERTQDAWAFWRKGTLHPLSNIQFGEGGAGTFSDGKLYSQIRDPQHLGRLVLADLVAAGAPPDILVDAHPHIGTFRLVKVVQSLRARIVELGGEVRFGHRVDDIELESLPNGSRLLRGLRVDGEGAPYFLRCDHAILATGHSARTTYAMLHDHGLRLEAKAFSVGVRIEHPQHLIDRARWGHHAGHPALGAAEYRLVHHASNGRTVYSFCMCPGGTVVAAASEPGGVVTNGMSQYSRQERNANAALVVGIDPGDFPQDRSAFVHAFGEMAGERYAQQALHGRLGDARGAHPLSGIALQRRMEADAFALGASSYEAPGQLLCDYLAGKASTGFGDVLPSYRPGVRPTNLEPILPPAVATALREALPAFGRKLRGFDLPDAVLTGVETRTSAPLRIVRGADFQSVNVPGLYPGGEGAGYAGGILSAAIDGIALAQVLGARLGWQA
ncbi:NAD(P)/FAD-dependent oxidoreductase [Candidatus Symbiobacter mobilis]|uniref:Dehydrogenase-like protein n=1 Tax=Candidatus Symbiobacter mobilis CR TaxID=946483 RepID=U5NAS5_9BURK|nr:dehydrogenase-like protein [Candidatus Symbiobacter mobilis]AGX88676.1 dehydrogenase-like protein [Candidatus Symbiobacter mobilis CR]